MAPASLSTWCRDPAAAPASFLDQAHELGAEAIALDSSLAPDSIDHWAEEVTRRRTPVVAVEAPCPRPRSLRPPHLAAADRDECRAAVDATRESLRLASRLGASAIVVRLGALALSRDWKALTLAFARRSQGPDATERLLAERVTFGAAALDRARFGLEPLLSLAAAEGVTIALANRARFFEIPDIAELSALLEEFRGAPLSPWYDAAAAHAREALGFAERGDWLAAFGARTHGAWLTDACGLRGGLPWGSAEVDHLAVEKALVDARAHVVHCAPGATRDELGAALAATARA